MRRSPSVSLPRQILLRLLLLAVAILPATTPLEAAHPDPKKFLFRLADNQKQVWTTPARSSTWKKTPTWVFIGLAAPSFSLDGDFSTHLRESTSLDGFNSFFASDTSDIIFATLPLVFVLSGVATGSKRFTDFGWKSTEVALTSWISTLGVKAVTQRSRPHEGHTYGFWKGGNSFSSGHAAVAWSLSALAVREFPDHRWVRWVAYPLAAAISISRISSGNHFASDVVFGSLLGYSVGRYLPR